MKHLYLACIAVLASGVSLMAQPTLTASTNNPVVGEVLFFNYCDTAGVRVGAGGASAVWNYATLTKSYTDTTYYVACATTPYCDSFTAPSLAATDMHGNYGYYVTSASGLVYEGSKNASYTYHYQSPIEFIYYPLTYNSMQVNIASETNYGVSYNYHDSFSCDGYGTLTLPTGTFNNALRVHEIQLVQESTGTATYNWRTDYYLWYLAGLHAAALVVELDTFGTGTQHTTSVYYTSMRPTGIAPITQANLQIATYPNPANNELNFTIDKKDFNSYSILSCSGQLMQSGAITENQNQLDINMLPAGFYLVQVSGTSGRAYCHFVKQ